MLNKGFAIARPLLSVIQKIRFEDFEKIDNGGISKKTSIIRDNQGIRGTGTSIHAFMCLKNVCK